MALGQASGELTSKTLQRPQDGVASARVVRRVAIVGAGLGGMAAALAAATAGATVEVFDAADRLRAPERHIDVVPNLLRDLVALGIGEVCVRAGFPYSGVAVVDLNGKALFEMPTPALAGSRMPPALGLGHAELLQLLHARAIELGASVRWQARVSEVIVTGDDSRIVLVDGSAARFDLVVLAGAAGLAATSATSAMMPTGEQMHARWDHVLLARPAFLDRATWVLGRGLCKVLLVPIGMTRAGMAMLRHRSIPTSTVIEADALSELRDALEEQGGLLKVVAGLLPGGVAVTSRPVRSALFPAPWHQGGVLRIGSSAHVLPPHFGQAVAQSIEDAVVLGDLLGAGLPRELLFARFDARRRERAASVHAVATQAARWDMKPEASTDLRALAQQLAPIVAHPA